MDSQFESEKTIELKTGTSKKRFVVAVPDDYEIDTAIDKGNLDADITSEYVLEDSSFTVKDKGGHEHDYKLYVMEVDTPYESNVTHEIKIK